MNIDLYEFIHRFFDEHPKDVEVVFYRDFVEEYRGSMWVRRLAGNIQFKGHNHSTFLTWSTLRKGEYRVTGIQPPQLVGQPNYRIKISHNPKRTRF